MKRIILPAICLATLMSITSCNSSKTASATAPEHLKTQTLGQTENVIEKVLYGDWFITRAGNLDLASSGSAMPIMSFGESQEQNPYLVNYSAYDGCNYNNGTYSVTPNGQMKLAGHPIATMKFCGDSPYEVGVVSGISSVASYTIDKQGDTYMLYLKNAAGETTLVLRKSNIDFINGAWTATLINGVSVPQSAKIELVIDVPQKSIHGNAACNMLNGKVSVDNNSGSAIHFSDLITTRMTCPNIDIEQSLINALATVTAVRPGPTSETAQLLNSEGNTVVELSRLDLK